MSCYVPFRAALAICACGVSLVAQSASDAPRAHQVRLRWASFDPLVAEPDVPDGLRAPAATRSWIVQCRSTPAAADRAAIATHGGRVLGYLPDDAYLVRISASGAASLRASGDVRWVGRYQPAYRIDPALIAAGAHRRAGPAGYNLVLADKHVDAPALLAAVEDLGGSIDRAPRGGLRVEASLTGAQLTAVAALDEVLWIDAVSRPELDMDNARIQGGGNYVEAQGGYTGTGIGAHVYEGIEETHPDFTGGATVVFSSPNPTAHGHATAGIVFGNGTSNPAVRGMAPDCDKFYTDFGTAVTSRWEVFDELVRQRDVSHTTASWGHARTMFYNSYSAEADDVVFDHDLAWTQTQGNGPSRESRPEAWAKNVFSIGGVLHLDDADPSNDTFLGSGTSVGPAADGRIKPTLVAYYDDVGTSDLTGPAGYSPNDWFAAFGGTSAATAIVAGHDVLAIEMYADDGGAPGIGLFGNRLRKLGGTPHENRPHFPTLKALMVASAAQYPFTATSADRRREQQGWGFPDLRALYDLRDKALVVDEVSVLEQGDADSWTVAVAAGEPALRVCLNWNEPSANPAAAAQRVNDLDLVVTSPTGVVYRGNAGLATGNWSTPGGSADSINTIECVFVAAPAAGTWTVEVVAAAVVADNHVETPEVDADYGLVVLGGEGPGPLALGRSIGEGCEGVRLSTQDRPVLGQSVELRTSTAPAGSLLGLSILSLQEIDPALDLTFLGMPGCEAHQPLDLGLTFALTGGAGAVTISLPATPSLAGIEILSQSATLSPGVNPFGFAISNGLGLTLDAN